MSSTIIQCPQCRDAGQTSEVRRGISTTTTEYWEPYFGEDGKKHHHNPNVATTLYKCSEGHQWAITVPVRPCRCGWSPLSEEGSDE